MKFSIITPSFNQLAYLKRCVASIADQQVDEIEHIVVDGGSTDGTVEWLARRVERQLPASSYQLAFISEADSGMYDALNKGICRASGNIIAWLNCDEQYLPGALAAVAGFFSQRPKVDLLHGDVLVVDPAGRLQGFWKSMPLRRSYIETGYLYNLSCGLFFRKHIFSAGCRFDDSFRAAADQCLIVDLLRQGVVSAGMRTYVAAYTFMPGNLSEQRFAQVERETLLRQAANQNRLSRVILRIMRQGERLLRGCRMQAFPLEYALYADDMSERRRFTSARVSSRWPGVRRNHG